jgi:hypothetical protein
MLSFSLVQHMSLCLHKGEQGRERERERGVSSYIYFNYIQRSSVFVRTHTYTYKLVARSYHSHLYFLPGYS